MLIYWESTGEHAFPSLNHFAQQTIGNQASAAQVDRNFSGYGNNLVPNRSSIDMNWVGMVLFHNANSRFIPASKDIFQVVSIDIRKCHPARFNGKNRALLAAKAAIDPLVNRTPTTEDGMDLGM